VLRYVAYRGEVFLSTRVEKCTPHSTGNFAPLVYDSDVFQSL